MLEGQNFSQARSIQDAYPVDTNRSIHPSLDPERIRPVDRPTEHRHTRSDPDPPRRAAKIFPPYRPTGGSTECSTHILRHRASPTILPTDAPTRGWARRLRSLDVRSPGHLIPRSPAHQMSDHQVTQSPNYLITRSSDVITYSRSTIPDLVYQLAGTPSAFAISVPQNSLASFVPAGQNLLARFLSCNSRAGFIFICTEKKLDIFPDLV